MKKCLLPLLLLSASLFAETTHSWVIPWVANKSDQWSGRILVVNSGRQDAEVTMKAVRADGTSQEVTATVHHNDSLAVNVGEAFSELGSGDGYSVFVYSTEPNLKATAIVSSLAAASGNSPSAGNAVPMADAHHNILYTYLPNGNGDVSAAVVVNTSSEAADVTLKVYSGNSMVGTSTHSVPAKTPWAVLVSELAGDATGNLSVEASSSANLVGASFVFNGSGEPSMVAAEAKIWEPSFTPLTDDDFYARDEAKEALGKMLFFDKIISGNMNISCATCHHPLAGTGDGFALPIGEGGTGLGVNRAPGDADNGGIHERVPRNAPAVFMLGAKEFTTMFHDGRVTVNPDHPQGFDTPAGDDLLPGLDNPLAAQAMFPVTSGAEMAGNAGENPVGDASAAGDLPALWSLLTARLMDNEEYRSMFSAAYPDINVPEDVTFAHAANAIGAFEAVAWRVDQSPFDHYIAGDKSAMSKSAVRGMSMFYGELGCGDCHAGVMQTDQSFYATAMVPAGPGKGDGVQGHDDFGRERVTGSEFDRYKFRVTTLRNVAISGPWGHSGSYNTLSAVVDHMLNPVDSFDHYDRSQLRVMSRADLDALDWIALDDEATREATKAASEIIPHTITAAQKADLMSFLRALTDPRSLDMRGDVPTRVPSGLPLAD